jgi:hypothetical protein
MVGWTVATVNQMLDAYQAMTSLPQQLSRREIGAEGALLAE